MRRVPYRREVLGGSLAKGLPLVLFAGWLSNEERPAGILSAVWLERGSCSHRPQSGVPPRFLSLEDVEEVMTVVIGIDPHKASHTAVALDGEEAELGSFRVRGSVRQVEELLAWAAPFENRQWAIESAGGLGYLLAQQLVAEGEAVVDVPATLVSRVRVLASGRANKNDPNDARSVAIAALRAPALRPVRPTDHATVLRLLAKRNVDIGKHRTRTVCRLHAVLVDLAPGGFAKELNASDVDRFLAGFTPADPVAEARVVLAVELLEDVRRLDAQLKDSHRRIGVAVRASATSLTDLFGVGPIIAATIIGYTGDVTRFRNRDHFAAYNGTAPAEFSSGGRVVHRVTKRGCRQLNHAMHLAALCQIRQPHSSGRAFFDRKVAEGKTKREALRALKRHVSNAVFRQLLFDASRSSR